MTLHGNIRNIVRNVLEHNTNQFHTHIKKESKHVEVEAHIRQTYNKHTRTIVIPCNKYRKVSQSQKESVHTHVMQQYYTH